MTKILLVEDDEMNRDMLSRRLQRLGYEIATAVDGQQAVELANDMPDIILMDIGLPVISGLEATRIIKNSIRTKNIPMIAITAHAMMGDHEKASAAGFDDYDTKPINMPRLLKKIQALLAK